MGNQLLLPNTFSKKITATSNINTLDSALQPACDTNAIKQQTLNNGLKVMYVNETAAMQTQFSLTQNVGSNFNPLKIQGLSHFLEHLLFMNSEKYPKIDQFREMVLKYNGDQNGGTGLNLTDFTFNVSVSNKNELKDILDIFVNMFISPIINDDNMKNEVNAVDSEFNINSTQEERHIQDVYQQQFMQNHPMANFTCGNKESLQDSIQDKEFLKNVSLLFRSLYYNPNNASLVVYGPLTEQYELIPEMFNQLVNLDYDKEQTSFSNKYKDIDFSDYFVTKEDLKKSFIDQLPLTNKFKAFEVKSVQDSNNLIILLEIKIDNQTKFKITLLNWIFKLLEQKKIGFINQYFKDMQNVLKFDADIVNQFEGQFLIEINFQLKASDLSDNDLLINLVKSQYAQLDYLLNLDVKILTEFYDQCRGIQKLNFDYNKPDQSDLMDNSTISANILEQGFEQAMNSHILEDNFDHDDFKSIIHKMINSKINVVLKPSSNMTKNEWEHTSNQYKAQFNVLCKDEHACRHSKWKKFLDQIRKIDKTKIRESCKIKFDLKSPKISNLSIDNVTVNNDQKQSPQKIDLPIVPADNKLNVFYLKEGQFELPISTISIQLNTNLVSSNIEYEILNKLYLQSIMHYFIINETKQSDLGYTIKFDANIQGFKIYISGFDKWLIEVFEKLIDQLLNKQLEQDILIKQIDLLILDKLSDLNEPSYKKALKILSDLMVKYKSKDDELQIDQMKKMKQDIQNTDQIKQFRTKLYDSVGKTDILIHGTIDQEMVQNIVQEQLKLVKKTDDKNIVQQEQVKLDKDINAISVPSFNPVETQTCLIFSQQIEFTDNIYKDAVLVSLLQSNLDNSIFTQLRTDKQIGYIASVDGGKVGDSVHMYSLIYGNKYSQSKMTELYHEWFEVAIKEEVELNKEDFESMKEGQYDSLQGQFRDIDDKSSNIFNQITQEEYNQMHLDDMFKELQKLELKEQLDFVKYVKDKTKKINLIVKPVKNKHDYKKSKNNQKKYVRKIKKMGYQNKKNKGNKSEHKNKKNNKSSAKSHKIKNK